VRSGADVTADYEAFVASKLAISPPTGFDPGDLMPEWLFQFQADLTRWALRRGRAAIFAGTGLGKMRMELAWASMIIAAGEAERALILAPLAVAKQLVREAEAVGVAACVCKSQADVVDGISVTNYDRVHLFDAGAFDAVGLDESSCIKHYDSGTLRDLLAAFRATRYRLAATATPAPNDWTELGTHAEFLGVCSRTEMLSEFFVHDGGDTHVWRLKGHARSRSGAGARRGGRSSGTRATSATTCPATTSRRSRSSSTSLASAARPSRPRACCSPRRPGASWSGARRARHRSRTASLRAPLS
jgi:hypothetical protein